MGAALACARRLRFGLGSGSGWGWSAGSVAAVASVFFVARRPRTGFSAGCAAATTVSGSTAASASSDRRWPSPDSPGDLGALLGGCRGDHRVVAGETERLAVSHGRQLMCGLEMAAQRLERLAADQADQMIALDRAADRHGRFRLGWHRLRFKTETVQFLTYVDDKSAEISDRNVMVSNVSRDDLGREGCDREALVIIVHDELSEVSRWRVLHTRPPFQVQLCPSVEKHK